MVAGYLERSPDRRGAAADRHHPTHTDEDRPFDPRRGIIGVIQVCVRVDHGSTLRMTWAGRRLFRPRSDSGGLEPREQRIRLGDLTLGGDAPFPRGNFAF